MEEKRIEVGLVKDDIATCNACLTPNYESEMTRGLGKVDELFEVRVGSTCLRFCKKCLLELVGKSATFLAKEEVSK